MTAPDRCLQIHAPHFTAGVVLSRFIAVRAAPIIRYMIGWSEARIREYARKKGWKVEAPR